MTHDPYKTPQAGLDSTLETGFPKKVLRKIRFGWMAACISSVLNLGYLAVASYSGEFNDPENTWYFPYSVLVLILAYGVYKKSRIAASLLVASDGSLTVAIAVESALAVEVINPVNITVTFGAVAIALLYFYLVLQGMIGTFQYQRIRNTHNKRLQTDAVINHDISLNRNDST